MNSANKMCVFLLEGRTSEKDMLYTQVAQQSAAG